jgi:hypothetical protein
VRPTHQLAALETLIQKVLQQH